MTGGDENAGSILRSCFGCLVLAFGSSLDSGRNGRPSACRPLPRQELRFELSADEMGVLHPRAQHSSSPRPKRLANPHGPEQHSTPALCNGPPSEFTDLNSRSAPVTLVGQ